MKSIHIIPSLSSIYLSFVLSLFSSCTNELDVDLDINNNTPNTELETYTFNLSTDNSFNTRSEHRIKLDNWQVYERYYNNVLKDLYLPSCFISDISQSGDFGGALCDSKTGFFTKMKYEGSETYIPNLIEKSTPLKFSLTVPKGILNSFSNFKFYISAKRSTYYKYNHSDVNLLLDKLVLSSPRHVRDSLKTEFTFSSYKDENQNFDEYKNILWMPNYTNCFLAEVSAISRDSTINTTATLKRMNSWVIVMTDEFEGWPNTENKWDTHNTTYIAPFLSSFFDYKTDRPFKEYIPDFVYNQYTKSWPSIAEGLSSYSFDTPIINLYTKQQYNILSQTYDAPRLADHSLFSGNTTVDWWDGGLTRSWLEADRIISNTMYYRHVFKQKSSNRRFITVSSRLVCMPFGRPKTLNTTIDGLLTHFDTNNDLDKEIKYLVICYYNDYNQYYSNGPTPFEGHWRAVIPIPEEGFKPGYVYIITNKPGTKLFKQWDEENATTRSGNGEEFVVDENCFDIEEYPF